MRRIILVLLLGLLASSCTVTDDTPASADRTPDPAVSEGGTLTVGIVTPVSIDPSRATERDPAGELVLSVLCDAPIDFDPVTGAIRPAVAERVQATESGTILTTPLRKDVHLHDGSIAGGEDVKAALDRAVYPEIVSPTADLLRPVVGWTELREGRSEGDSLFGARAPSPTDVELRLLEPRGELMRVFGHPIAAPLPREVVETLHEEEDDDAFSPEPICSGPYRLAGPWDPRGEGIRLVRFDDYYGKNAAFTRGGAGYVDEILFRTYADLDGALEGYRAGEVDVVHVPEGRLEEARSLGRVVSTPTSRIDFVGLPTSTEPFGNRLVRIALSQALDREALNEVVYGGARFPAGGILPPSVGDELHRGRACGINAPLSGDVEAARATLADSGVSLEGLTVPLYFNDEHGHRELMEEVARQWQEAFGLEAELMPMGWEAYLQEGTDADGFDGPFRFSWSAEYPSAHEYLDPLFHSGRIGTSNLMRFSDRDLDRALERDARRATTPEDQIAEYLAIEDRVCAQMPLVPVTYGAAHYLFRENVDSAIGRFTDITTGRPALRELYLSS